jgi:hypothetical protein
MCRQMETAYVDASTYNEIKFCVLILWNDYYKYHINFHSLQCSNLALVVSTSYILETEGQTESVTSLASEIDTRLKPCFGKWPVLPHLYVYDNYHLCIIFWCFFNPTWQHLITKWGKLFTWWKWKCNVKSFQMKKLMQIDRTASQNIYVICIIYVI